MTATREQDILVGPPPPDHPEQLAACRRAASPITARRQSLGSTLGPFPKPELPRGTHICDLKPQHPYSRNCFVAASRRRKFFAGKNLL